MTLRLPLSTFIVYYLFILRKCFSSLWKSRYIIEENAGANAMFFANNFHALVYSYIF